MKKQIAAVLLATLLLPLLALPVSADEDDFFNPPLSDHYSYHDYLDVTVGETVSLVPLMIEYDSERHVYAIGPRAWSSRKPEVASVAEDGDLTAWKEGVAEIRVSYSTNRAERVTETVRVRVTEGGTTRQPDNIIRINIGKVIDLKKLLFPGAEDGSFQWKVKDDFLAEVDENGVLEALVAGSCYITATRTATDGAVTEKSVYFEVTAEHHAPLNQLKLTLAPGETVDLINGWFADEKQNKLRHDYCRSSSIAVAAIEDDQRITAKKPGESDVTIIQVFRDDEESRQRVQIVVQ